MTSAGDRENGNTINAGAVADNQSSGTFMTYAALTKAIVSSASSADAQTAAASLPIGRFHQRRQILRSLGRSEGARHPVGIIDRGRWLCGPQQFPILHLQSERGTSRPELMTAIGTLEHEFSEVLGRVDYAGQGSSTGNIHSDGSLSLLLGWPALADLGIGELFDRWSDDAAVVRQSGRCGRLEPQRHRRCVRETRRPASPASSRRPI